MDVSVVVVEPILRRQEIAAPDNNSCNVGSSCIYDEELTAHHPHINSHTHTQTHQSPSYHRSYHILPLVISVLQLQLVTITNAQTYSETDIVPNPQNKYCGMSYAEAQQFCHLPPNKSLPCPNDAETECPYNMPCWEILDPCTAPPVMSPTASPITERSVNPRDHNFCGLGFDNLFGW